MCCCELFCTCDENINCCRNNGNSCCKNCAICCKGIKCKRYFLPIVLGPIALIHNELQNYTYVPILLGISAFILFWNFPKIVYYTASKPLFYEDLFIDEKKLPNYDVNPRLKIKFQKILVWVLIVTNSMLVAALGDYWLYRTLDTQATFEILGITGGIIKIFQILNNTISRIMLKILKKFIKRENQKIRRLEVEKMKQLVKFNFKLNMLDKENQENKLIELSKLNNVKRDRILTI